MTAVRFLKKYRFVLTLILAVLMTGSIALGVGKSAREINFVTITGDINKQQRSALEQQLVEIGSLSEITQVKRHLEEAPWIQSVQVGRHWPDELTIQVMPRKPIAYWNEKEFISGDGIVFESDYLTPGPLPQLHGRPGAEKVVMERYQQLNRALLKTGQFVDVLSLNERGSLEFENQLGVVVALGNVDLEARLQRFIRVSESLENSAVNKKIQRIDTRYSNGVAVDFFDDGEPLDVANNIKLQREASL